MPRLPLPAVLALTMGACDPPGVAGVVDGGAAGAPAGGGAAPDGGSAGSGGARGGDGPGFGFTVPDGGDGSVLPPSSPGGGGDTPTCAAQRFRAQRVSADVALLMDISSSMDLPWGSATKLEGAKRALTAFVRDPQSSGLGVSLTFFPIGPVSLIPSMSGEGCLPATYQRPAVPFADLPAAAPALTMAIDALKAAGGTPTSPAVQGVLAGIRSRQTAVADRRTVLVLATDGAPTGCADNLAANTTNHIREAAAWPRPVSTYVIGIFSAEPMGGPPPGVGGVGWGNQGGREAAAMWATAGGTGKPFILDPNVDLTPQLVTALNDIRRQVQLPCEFVIPRTMPGGGAIDFGKVNVRLTTPAGFEDLGYVGSRDRCDARGGWYYDVDPRTGSPTRILVCETTCQKFKAAADPVVDLVYGCQTKVIE